MKSKSNFKSKAIWSGFLLFISGVLKIIGDYLSAGTLDFPAIIALFNGLGIMGIRWGVDDLVPKK